MMKGRRYLWGFLLLVFTVSVVGCSTVPYRKTLNNWTEGKKIYSPTTFGSKLQWFATYLSPEYRAVAREQINVWKGYPEDGYIGYVDYIASTEPGVFLVSVYTPRGDPPISVEGDHYWEFTLNLPNGQALVPTSMDTIEVTSREKRLFPYVNRWSTFYRVKFPVGELERPFSLVLRSVPVTSILTFKEKGKITVDVEEALSTY